MSNENPPPFPPSSPQPPVAGYGQPMASSYPPQQVPPYPVPPQQAPPQPWPQHNLPPQAGFRQHNPYHPPAQQIPPGLAMLPVKPPLSAANRAFSTLLLLGLGVSGGLGLFALLVPDAVVLGLYMLILPGLILGSMPTVFLYLSLFSCGWFLFRRTNPSVGAALGVALMLAVAVWAPWLYNLQLSVATEEATSLDKMPAKPLFPAVPASAAKQGESSRGAGVPLRRVALQLSKGETSQHCGALCLLLLYTDQAGEVVVLPPEEEQGGGEQAKAKKGGGLFGVFRQKTTERRRKAEPGAYVYSLVQEEGCPALMNPGHSGSFGLEGAQVEAIARGVRFQMAGGRCLFERPIGDAEKSGEAAEKWQDGVAWTLRRRVQVVGGSGAGTHMSNKNTWHFGPKPVLVEAWEVLTGGGAVGGGDAKVVARTSTVRGKKITMPLFLTPRMSGMGANGWEFDHRQKETKAMPVLAFLGAATGMANRDLGEPTLGQLRQALDRVLDQPERALSAAQLTLVAEYVRLVDRVAIDAQYPQRRKREEGAEVAEASGAGPRESRQERAARLRKQRERQREKAAERGIFRERAVGGRVADEEGMKPELVADEDIERLARIIRDRRVVSLDQFPAWRIRGRQSHGLLREALLARLEWLATAEDWKNYRMAERLLAAQPPGSFARPLPRVEALLANAEARWYSPTLVTRLAEQGAEVAPRLVGFLAMAAEPVLSDAGAEPPSAGDGGDRMEAPRGRKGGRIVGTPENGPPQSAEERQQELARRQEERRAREARREQATNVAQAAVRGLCELGPAAASQLPRLQEMEKQAGFANWMGKREDWQLMLLRLGDSPERMMPPYESPNSRLNANRVKQHQRRLLARAEKGCQ